MGDLMGGGTGVVDVMDGAEIARQEQMNQSSRAPANTSQFVPSQSQADHKPGSGKPSHELLLSLPGVSLVEVVESEGRVEALAAGTLEVFSETSSQGRLAITAKIEGRQIPLGPDTQCLRSRRLQYMFLLPTGQTWGADLPEDAPSGVLELFEALLGQCCQFAVEDESGPAALHPNLPQPAVVKSTQNDKAELVSEASQKGPQKVGEQLADIITTNAVWVEEGIRGFGKSASMKITSTGQSWKQSAPAADPNSSVKLPLVAVSAAKAVNTTAGVVDTAAKNVVNGIVWGISAVASGVVNTAKAVGVKGPEKPVLGVRASAVACVDAVGRVFDALEGAGKDVLVSTSTQSSDYVTHRYGPRAGEVTSLSLGGMGHLAHAGYTMRKISVRGLGRRVVKKTALFVIRDGQGRVVGVTEKAPGSVIRDEKGNVIGKVHDERQMVEEVVEQGQDGKEGKTVFQFAQGQEGQKPEVQAYGEARKTVQGA